MIIDANDLGGAPVLAVQRVFSCRCGLPVFFRNSHCIACNTPLGYDPERATLLPLQPDEADPALWRRFGSTGEPPRYRRCANLDNGAACNWLIDIEIESARPLLCRSCRLNRMIPDLSIEENAGLWRDVERAKRRLVSQLIALGLPVRSRVSEDPAHGLAFDVMRPVDGGPPLRTGHENGIITLNLEEADDAKREQTRIQLHEPYRTLLGHLRHEVGHYYWQLLIEPSKWIKPWRELFGAERRDYAAALQQHYADGPPPDWALSHVSAYAAAHPWEDWAETWAHYLHMVDTLDTASSFGLTGQPTDLRYEQFDTDSLWRADAADAARFLGFVNTWIALTGVLNELSRSMGQPDFYPFVLTAPAVAKLQFVHALVVDAAQSAKL